MNPIQFNKVYSYLRNDKFAYVLVKKIKNVEMTENKQKLIKVIEGIADDKFMRINVNITKMGGFSLQNVAKKTKCNAYLMRLDILQDIATMVNLSVDSLLSRGDIICRPLTLIRRQQDRQKINVANRKYNEKVKTITFATKQSPKYLVNWADKNKDKLLKSSTKYERMLFNELKKHFKDKVKKQHPFIIKDKLYYADIYIPSLRLIIEVDGGYHKAKEQQIKDKKRDIDFRSMGHTTLRVTNEQVQDKLSRQQIINKILNYNA